MNILVKLAIVRLIQGASLYSDRFCDIIISKWNKINGFRFFSSKRFPIFSCISNKILLLKLCDAQWQPVHWYSSDERKGQRGQNPRNPAAKKKKNLNIWKGGPCHYGSLRLCNAAVELQNCQIKLSHLHFTENILNIPKYM